jgi:thiamine transport system substrate-binding protein
VSARRTRGAALAVALAATLVGCGGDGTAVEPTTIRLVTYDSFPSEDTPLNEALAEFTADTGLDVQIVRAGDTGTMVTKAVLAAGNPEGDVMWGVDNTFLSAATDGGIFDGTPALVDEGDVCVNYDVAWFTEQGLEPPATFDDLLDPALRGQLVVQNPSTSSPGLAFLLGTIAEYGEDGWQDYWAALRDNDVEVVDSWDTAYYDRFSGSGGGDRPLVVSYGTSPPAEVVFAAEPLDSAPTGVAVDTCFRQQEFAGVLRGTPAPEGAVRLLEFLQGERFQRELPLTLFVFPTNDDVVLPEVFARYAVRPDISRTIDTVLIAEQRAAWQDEWTQIVLR